MSTPVNLPLEISEIAYEGSVFTIEFYKNKSGIALSKEWLEEQPEKLQQKFAALFVYLGDQGKIWNEQKFKHLTGTDQIFEFKCGQGRVCCFFFVGQRVILTNGFIKKSKKTPKRA